MANGTSQEADEGLQVVNIGSEEANDGSRDSGDTLQRSDATSHSSQEAIVTSQEINHSEQEIPKPGPPTYSEDDRPLLASEIKQKLLDCGLIRKPPPPIYEDIATGQIKSNECYIGRLPIELRQQIMLTYITSSPLKVETWNAPYFAGRDEDEALVVVPCKISWWLRGLRVLNLMATCKSWKLELIYVVEYLEIQVKDEYDHELDRANSGLQRLRGRTTAGSEPTMRAYLREYRKSYVNFGTNLTTLSYLLSTQI
jgi:hypothetical protein